MPSSQGTLWHTERSQNTFVDWVSTGKETLEIPEPSRSLTTVAIKLEPALEWFGKTPQLSSWFSCLDWDLRTYAKFLGPAAAGLGLYFKNLP